MAFIFRILARKCRRAPGRPAFSPPRTAPVVAAVTPSPGDRAGRRSRYWAAAGPREAGWGVEEAPPGCRATTRPGLTVRGCGSSRRYSARSAITALKAFRSSIGAAVTAICDRSAGGFALTTKFSP